MNTIKFAIVATVLIIGLFSQVVKGQVSERPNPVRDQTKSLTP